LVLAPAAASEVRRIAEKIGTAIAGPVAADIDKLARFPTESIAALRAERLLTVGAPPELGGLGLGVSALADVAQVLAQSCASTAMIWAMHQIQLACLVRHGQGVPFFDAYLRQAVQDQLLIASVTSEVGVGGDIRSSIASIEHDAAGLRLTKHGATISYGANADAYLVTVRRASDAAAGEQVLVLVKRSEALLEQTGEWDSLGMRGTCSPSFRLTGMFGGEQVLPVPFADICGPTMVPFSHILWSACWLGIATDAVRRAREFVKSRAVRAAAPVSSDHRLADMATLLQQMRATIAHSARRYDQLLETYSEKAFSNLGLAIEMNELKLAASDLVVRIVSLALSICGMAGYQATGPYSVARNLRDAYSAICMISNERLREANAAMLLLHKES
jgi:acyl-CoA dehydrogenase